MRDAPKAVSAWPSKRPASLGFLGVAVKRLATRAQFQAVMAGTAISRSEHFVLHRLIGTSLPPSTVLPENRMLSVDGVWIGALVPKRWAKRAVTRNTIKRQIYSLCQAHRSQFDPTAHVVRLRASFDKKVFISATSAALKESVRTEILYLLDRASRASAVEGSQ
jgi:ribonuclease P protein component